MISDKVRPHHLQRKALARYEKALRGELVVAAPVGFVKAGNRYEKGSMCSGPSWMSVRLRSL